MPQTRSTPAEFARDVWRAWADLFCTTEEAEAAIAAYQREYVNDIIDDANSRFDGTVSE